MSAGTQQVAGPWTPAPPQLVMAYSVCKGITRSAAKNFYYAFLALPRRKHIHRTRNRRKDLGVAELHICLIGQCLRILHNPPRRCHGSR